MAPAGTTTSAGRPKRKRQRRRRTNVDSDDELDLSSSSGESSSSSSDDDSDDEPTKSAPAPAKAPSAGSSSSDSDSDDEGADSDSSSGSDLSFLSDHSGGRGRRGRGRRRGDGAAPPTAGAPAAAQAASALKMHQAQAQAHARRPYPERSPSPSMLARADPSAFVPLGTSLFPLLEKRVPKSAVPAAEGEEAVAGEEGARVLEGLVEGDDAGPVEGEPQEAEGKKREDRFGEWWRARLVSEFEGDLGGLAAEPGLTPSRLQLLLTSLTTLSSLHTSSALPPSARSIWAHDPSAPLDPLAALPPSAAEDPADWAATKVGGAGDVEVGDEGVAADERRSAKAKAKKERRKSAPVPEAVKMVFEEEAAAQVPASSPAKKEKKSKRKGRKSGASEAGERMDVDE